MRSLLFLTVLFCSITSYGQKKHATFIKSRPMPAHAVNDFGKLLKKDEKQYLEEQSKFLQKKLGNGVVVITLPALPNSKTNTPDELLELAGMYFDDWELDQKKTLILVTRKPLMVGLRIGTSVDSLMTKADLHRILNEYILSSFDKNQVFIGLKDGFNAIESTIVEARALQEKKEQEAVAGDQTREQQSQPAYSPYKPQQKEMTLGQTIVGFLGLGVIIFYFVYRKRRRGVLMQSEDGGFDSEAVAWLTKEGITARRTVNEH